MKKVFKVMALAFLGLTFSVGLIQARQFPSPINFVSDFANIIDDQSELEMNESLKTLQASTSAQVAVVTLDSLEGDVIENVAVELFAQWGIGTKEKDNGLLLLVAPNEREVRIEVGYGLEPIITDSRSGSIIRTIIIPRFKENNYNQGVIDGVSAIEKIILGDSATFDLVDTPANSNSDTFVGIIFGGIILIYLSSFFARSKRYWPGGAIGFLIGIFQGSIVAGIFIGLFGLFLDYILSNNYKKRVAKGLPTSWWSSGGGFSSGGSSGSSFGGFSGGSSGGGGSSSSW